VDWFSKAFIKASVAWLALGVTLGVAMAMHPAWVIYRPAHLHMNLLGFVAMMIFGVAYHVLPRFTGHPLHSRRLAAAHWWIANLGLVLFAAGFMLAPHGRRFGAMLIAAGGTLSALGAYSFVYNVWRTLDGRARRLRATVQARAAGAATGRRLPIASREPGAA
jgi:cbb3-type cytochrome oxidase subunit 1